MLQTISARAVTSDVSWRRAGARAIRVPVEVVLAILGKLNLLIVLAAVLIESCLGYRVYAQVTGADLHGVRSTVFSVSSFLVSPFKSYETARPIRESGILELSTLVAIESYMAGALVVLAILWLINALVRELWRANHETSEA